MDDTTVVVSSGSYPWDRAVEQSFLDLELRAFAQRFGRVVVVPQATIGARLACPPGIEVDESYAREVGRLGRVELCARAARTSIVPEDLLRRAGDVLHRRSARELVRFAGLAHHAADWAARFASRERLNTTRLIFYSFWWGAPTTGFGLARRDLRGLRVVTRAHGFDLYEDRHVPAYIPARHRSLRAIDAVFPDSDRGRDYLAPAAARAGTRCETARLGVEDPGLLCPPSQDGVLRVVSCSLQQPVKRLDLLLRGLACFGVRHPARTVCWTHFGTGPLQADLQALARRLFPSNVTVHFAGYSTQADLLRWYGQNPVDVFVNVSSSEGTPVAVIEAVACGIPIMATRVGGNPEVATGENGVQLSPDPSPEDLAEALSSFTPGSPRTGPWRSASREVWRARYDATTNYKMFADILHDLAPRVPA